MDIWNIKELNFAIVDFLFLIALTCQHISQGSIVASSIIDLEILSGIYLFDFGYFIYAFNDLFDQLLILFTPIAHQSSLDLTTTKDTAVRLWLILVEVRKGRHTLSGAEFGCSKQLLFGDV
jgi:hypothetical protein